MNDYTKTEGTLAERKLFNGKDVEKIRKGKNPQGITMVDVDNSITDETRSGLLDMREKIETEGIVIKDFQLMYGENGEAVIADPLDAYIVESSDPKALRAHEETLSRLDTNIDMVDGVLARKSKGIS